MLLIVFCYRSAAQTKPSSCLEGEGVYPYYYISGRLITDTAEHLCIGRQLKREDIAYSRIWSPEQFYRRYGIVTPVEVVELRLKRRSKVNLARCASINEWSMTQVGEKSEAAQ